MNIHTLKARLRHRVNRVKQAERDVKRELYKLQQQLRRMK